LKKKHQAVVSVTYGSSNEQIYFKRGIIMENLRAQFMKWRRRTSTHKYTRLEECSDQLIDAVHQPIAFPIIHGCIPRIIRCV
jgi:hypothetical protein